MIPLKIPWIVAVSILAVLLRAAAFLHNPAAYLVAALLWLTGVLILFPLGRK